MSTNTVQYTLEQVAEALRMRPTIVSRLATYFKLPHRYYGHTGPGPKLQLFNHQELDLLLWIKYQIAQGTSLSELKKHLLSLNTLRTVERSLTQVNSLEHDVADQVGVHNPMKAVSLLSTHQAESSESESQIEESLRDPTDDLVEYERSQDMKKEMAARTMQAYRKQQTGGGGQTQPFQSLLRHLQMARKDLQQNDQGLELVDSLRVPPMSLPIQLSGKLQFEGPQSYTKRGSLPEPYPFSDVVQIKSWITQEQRARVAKLQDRLLGYSESNFFA